MLLRRKEREKVRQCATYGLHFGSLRYCFRYVQQIFAYLFWQLLNPRKRERKRNTWMEVKQKGEKGKTIFLFFRFLSSLYFFFCSASFLPELSLSWRVRKITFPCSFLISDMCRFWSVQRSLWGDEFITCLVLCWKIIKLPSPDAFCRNFSWCKRMRVFSR